MIPLLSHLVPCVAGTIKRRILVNFRIEPSRVAKILPPPFHPQLVGGKSLVGICLIRLEHLRPTWVPERFGLSSENAAHRIAVEWTRGGRTHQGVFVTRRHTDSTLNQQIGGRIFPGVHRKAEFEYSETGDGLRVALSSAGGAERTEVRARFSETVPTTSVFADAGAASCFFRQGCEGWSIAQDGFTLEGARLEVAHSELRPLRVEQARSSLFEEWFGTGGGELELDSAFLMRDVPHRWFSLGKWADPRSAEGLSRQRPHRHAALFELP